MVPAWNIQPMSKPITPAQALNNFRLLRELSGRNSYADYRASVNEIADAVLSAGIAPDADAMLNALRAMPAVLRGRDDCHAELRMVAEVLIAAGDTHNCNGALADDVLIGDDLTKPTYPLPPSEFYGTDKSDRFYGNDKNAP